MRRVMIIGSGGSGKSTLPRQIGKILNIEVFHLDAIHWKPGWVEAPWERMPRKNRLETLKMDLDIS